MALERLLEGMKAVKDIFVETYDNVSLMSKAGYLRLFTAVMPAVGACSETNNYYYFDGVQAKGCASDAECRDLEQCIYNNDLETNICYDSSGVADYSEGSSGHSGDDDDRTCGGSPLVGKTLTALLDCDSFIVFQEDCKASVYGMEQRSDDPSLFHMGFCDYSGMNLLNCNDSYFRDTSFTFYSEWDGPSRFNECQKAVFQRLDSYIMFSERALEHYEDPTHPFYHWIPHDRIWTSIDRQLNSSDDCDDLKDEILAQLGYERSDCWESVPRDQPE